MFLQKLIYRRSLCIALVIFFIGYLNPILSFAENFWVMLTTLLVMQTAVGLTARQALQRFILIIFCVIFASCFVYAVDNRNVINVTAVIFFTVLCYFSGRFSLARAQVMIPLMTGIVVLVALIMPCQTVFMIQARMMDVTIGGIIGFFASILIFPVKADVEFRNKTMPLLNACDDYLTAIVQYIFDHSLEQSVQNKKIQLEKIWENFPDWVYEVGFTATLQQGHRHFLVRIEEVRQILFMLHHLARYSYEEDLLNKLHGTMLAYQSQLSQLLKSLMNALALRPLSEDGQSLVEDFVSLEKKFKTIMPYSLEVMELNQEHVYMANFIAEMRELGRMLMILTKTLDRGS